MHQTRKKSASTATPAAPLRSSSLPSRFQLLSFDVEKDLQKVRAWETSTTACLVPTADDLAVGVALLDGLYSSVEEALHLPANRKAARRLGGEGKYMDEILDGYIGLLDACEAMGKTVSFTKEKAGELHSVLRRRGADKKTIMADVEAFTASRKAARKMAHGCLKASERREREHECKCESFDAVTLYRTLTDVRHVSVIVLTSLAEYFLRSDVNGRWCCKPRGILHLHHHRHHPKKVAAAELLEDDLGRVDSAVYALHCHLGAGKGEAAGDDVKAAQNRLSVLGAGMEVLEVGLEKIFRGLIRNRVSLLNILNQ